MLSACQRDEYAKTSMHLGVCGRGSMLRQMKHLIVRQAGKARCRSEARKGCGFSQNNSNWSERQISKRSWKTTCMRRGTANLHLHVRNWPHAMRYRSPLLLCCIYSWSYRAALFQWKAAMRFSHRTTPVFWMVFRRRPRCFSSSTKNNDEKHRVSSGLRN